MSIYYPTSTADLLTELAEYKALEKAIKTGQNYSIEGLSVSRPDLDSVRRAIKEIERELTIRNHAAAGRSPVMVATWK